MSPTGYPAIRSVQVVPVLPLVAWTLEVISIELNYMEFGWIVDSCGVRIKSGKVAYCVINKSTWTWTAFPDLMRTPQLSTTHSNKKRQLLLHSLALWEFLPTNYDGKAPPSLGTERIS